MTSPRSQLCLKAKLFNDMNLEVTFWILFYKIEEVEEDKGRRTRRRQMQHQKTTK